MYITINLRSFKVLRCQNEIKYKIHTIYLNTLSNECKLWRCGRGLALNFGGWAEVRLNLKTSSSSSIKFKVDLARRGVQGTQPIKSAIAINLQKLTKPGRIHGLCREEKSEFRGRLLCRKIGNIHFFHATLLVT